jgi:2,3-bisphosphoglycerate-independent phosphoglycerate mutase
MESDKSYPIGNGVREAYQRGEEDEAMNPIVLGDGAGKPVGRIQAGEPVIFYDIRGEREVQITECFTDPGFPHFSIPDGHQTPFVTMIEYDPKLKVDVAFPPESVIENSLCEVVSKAGMKQVKVVETEKAVHLGFFLNGKKHEPYPGERRCFIESLKVTDYGEHPRMEIEEVVSTVKAELAREENDLIIANFANTDVIGHIENRDAVITAVEAVDRATGEAVEKARALGMDVLITADHGTVEAWLYPDGKVDTGHTASPVPFIFIEAGAEPDSDLQNDLTEVKGSLVDVAPTALPLLGLETPSEMTGQAMFARRGKSGGRRRLFLLICDGWGYNASPDGNMIAAANTPHIDGYLANWPTVLLHAAGPHVGMPDGTVGNSESGHLHIGTGRVIYSDRLRIDRSLADESFYQNEAFLKAMNLAKAEKKPLHFLGIVSFFSSHGSLDHLFALMKMARDNEVEEVYIHSLLGRRGERPEAGARYIEDVQREADRLGLGTVVTVMGRYWALDREYNWDRIERTYRALVHGEGNIVTP